MPFRRGRGRPKKAKDEEDDDDDDNEEEDITYSPTKSGGDSRESSYSLRQRSRTIDDEQFVELYMDCKNEELLPAQLLYYKHLLTAHESANKEVQQMKVQQQKQLEVETAQENFQRQQKLVTVALNKLKCDVANDVIIIGDSLPQIAPVQSTPIVTVPPPIIIAAAAPKQPQQLNFINCTPAPVTNIASNQWVIRPMMRVIPQQNSGSYTVPQAVIQTNPRITGAFPSSSFQNITISPATDVGKSIVSKTPVNPQNIYMTPVKKTDSAGVMVPTTNSRTGTGALVPLDEYYYGKKEGDPTYAEEKTEYRFKCWYCSKMLYNNVKIMMHMQGHIDSEKQHNLDLSDLTQCKHCYKQFDTPFEMQTHIEKVHMNNANVLLCRICEKDHENRQTLTNHMRQNHNACEMPYLCHLCLFRSSMYSDVVDHFKKKHEHSAHVMCLYCLKVFNIKFVAQGWGQTQNFYHHLLRHQSKANAKKCQLCKLTFFNSADVKNHRRRDHMPNQKGVIGMNSKHKTPDQVMIRVPESGLHPKQQVKSLNAPAVSKITEHRGLRIPAAVHSLNCFECKMVMGMADHYKKYIQCSMCRYATSCSFAYANHMLGFHSGQVTSLNLSIPWEKPLPSPLYCLCGFGSRYGNSIANHLVFCTKRCCYKDKPILPPQADQVDDTDPRRKPGASLLDVLGLVKKPNLFTRKRFGTSESREVTPAPVLTRSSPVPPKKPKVNRKWLTIRLRDPSKSAEKRSHERAFTPEPEELSNDVDMESTVNALLVESEDETADKDNEKTSSEAMSDRVRNKESSEEENKEGSTCKSPVSVDDVEQMSLDASLDKNTDAAESETSHEKMDSEVADNASDKSPVQYVGTEISGNVNNSNNQYHSMTSLKKRIEEDLLEMIDDTNQNKKTSDGRSKPDSDIEDVVTETNTEQSQSIPVEKSIGASDVEAEMDSSLSEHAAAKDDLDAGQNDCGGIEEASLSETEHKHSDKLNDVTVTSDVIEDENERVPKTIDDAEEDTSGVVTERAEPIVPSSQNVAEDVMQDVDTEDVRNADESNDVSKIDDDTTGVETFYDAKEVNETDETADCSKHDDTEDVSKHEDASKPDETEDVSKPDETEDASKSEETEDVSKPNETEDVSKPNETEDVSKPDETEDASKPDVTEDVSIPDETEDVSKPDETEVVSKADETVPDETKDVNKPEVVSKDVNLSDVAKDVPEPDKSVGKAEDRDDFTKIEGDNSPGKDDVVDKMDSQDSDHRHADNTSLKLSQESKKELKSPDMKSPDNERSPDSQESPDLEKRYRDRSNDRDRDRSRDRGGDRSSTRDRDRGYERGYERDRDRREHHRSDRDRHGGSGYRDRHDDRHYGDNRNYNRHNDGHRGDSQDGYRGNQRDRYSQNRGYQSNRDYRDRQGHRSNY